VSSLNLKLTDNNSKADGVDTDSGQVTVRDASGKVMSGVPVSWSVDHSATIVHSDAVTDGSGHASVEYTDTKAESVKLTASASGKTESTDSAFVAAATTNTISVSMTTDNSQADGVTPNVARATVKDSTGKVLSGVTVNWSTTGSAKLAAASSVTDGNGNATVNLTDTVAESGLTVTATAGDATGTTTTTFVGIQQNIAVEMTTDNSPADGTTPNVARATVTDGNGKPLSGVTVNWTTTGSAKLAATSTVTDGSGVATVNLTDTVAESGVTVTATTDNAKGSTTTTFKSALDKITVTTTTDNSPADGMSTDVVNALVTDSNGKALPNVTVNWATTGSAKLAAASSVTDSAGNATVSLTDTTPETGLTVTATVGEAKGTTLVTFSELQQDVTVTMKVNNSVADGKTQNIAQVVVLKDNRPVSGAEVSWSKDSNNAKNASSPTAYTDNNGIATMAYTDTVAETFNVVATVGDETGKTQSTFVSPAFGPITILMPEVTAGVVNYDIALGGTPVVIQHYNGMAAGDQIAVSSNVSGDKNGQTMDYSAPVHTVTAGEVGQDISVMLPESKLMGIQGTEETTTDAAWLHVKAVVTQGDKTQTATLDAPIDTCLPGTADCRAN